MSIVNKKNEQYFLTRIRPGYHIPICIKLQTVRQVARNGNMYGKLPSSNVIRILLCRHQSSLDLSIQVRQR